MITNQPRIVTRIALLLLLGMALLECQPLRAQSTTVSSVPASGATGVSTTAAVIFTFSGMMDTASTTASFYSLSPPGAYPVTSVWSSGDTVLTCTPVSPFPANGSISWVVGGQDVNMGQVVAQGSFTTGTGGGTTGGSGTNRITTFTLGKIHSYDQTSAAAPSLATTIPFEFGATTVLASNRTANSVTLTLPTLAISNLTQNLFAKEDFYLVYAASSSNALETTFPQGTYTYNITATASNQSVAVTLPASMTQPNAPHVANYTAAQAVSASQPFTLSWNAFEGGTAGDYIYVSVDSTNSGAVVWKTPDYGATGALDGTASSATIPANTLQSNSSYDVTLGFYRATWSSNVTYVTGAYRATVTRLNLSTIGSSAPLPVVSSPAWTGGAFGFDIGTAPGQQLTILSTTNCAQPLSSWAVLLTTNSPGTIYHFSDPVSVTQPAKYYSVRNGP